MKQLTRVVWGRIDNHPTQMDKLACVMECDDGSIYVAEIEDDEAVPWTRLEVVARIEDGERNPTPNILPTCVNRQVAALKWLEPEPHATVDPAELRP